MSFLSLPFAALSNLQIVIRLRHGTLDDLAFSLVPLEELQSSQSPSGPLLHCGPDQTSSSSYFHKGWTDTNPQQSTIAFSLANVPYSMNFQAAHDDQGPVLKVFASQTGPGAPANNVRLTSHRKFLFSSWSNRLVHEDDYPR